MKPSEYLKSQVHPLLRVPHYGSDVMARELRLSRHSLSDEAAGAGDRDPHPGVHRAGADKGEGAEGRLGPEVVLGGMTCPMWSW